MPSQYFAANYRLRLTTGCQGNSLPSGFTIGTAGGTILFLGIWQFSDCVVKHVGMPLPIEAN
jgi:hypothetical protein